MRAKTAKSSDKREASTTEDDIAAFIDSTEVNLTREVVKFVNRTCIAHEKRFTSRGLDHQALLDCNRRAMHLGQRGMLKEPKLSPRR
jgi:hypothetical protein